MHVEDLLNFEFQLSIHQKLLFPRCLPNHWLQLAYVKYIVYLPIGWKFQTIGHVAYCLLYPVRPCPNRRKFTRADF